MLRLSSKIYIDFRKAFGTVNHDMMLDEWECYRKSEYANTFCRSYLTHRRLYTLVNGMKSNFGYVNFEVPQGSGPLIFLCYINNIKHVSGCDGVSLFDDDPFPFTIDRNIDASKKKQVIYLKNSRFLPTNYPLTAKRQMLSVFMQRISSFRNTFNVKNVLPLIE